MEKRKHERVPLGVPVQCQSGPVEVEGRAENVSAGGLFLVRAGKTFAEDDEITVTFEIPGSTQTLRARVVHEVPDRFMGVEFLDLSPESKELIAQYVAAHSGPEDRPE